MRRSRSSWRVGVALLTVLAIQPVAAVDARTVPAPPRAVVASADSVPNAVTWKVDHEKKTITVSVKIEIYSACEDCGRPATAFIAEKIRAQVDRVWNQGYHYRCYLMVFQIDVKVGSTRSAIDPNRVGVGIDNSAAGIRPFVAVQANDEPWNSNDPAHRAVPVNSTSNPTTWGEFSSWDNIYAHEYGHLIGLSDQYHDIKDANGNVLSVANKDAPIDIMSSGRSAEVARETINRAVERSGKVDPKSLKCGWITESHVAPVDWFGKKCDEVDGEWLVRGKIVSEGLTDTWMYRATIDPKTNKGTYKYESISEIAQATLTKNGSGAASIVERPDGSRLLTVATTTVKGVITPFVGPPQSVDLVVPGTTFTWKPIDDDDECVPPGG